MALTQKGLLLAAFLVAIGCVLHIVACQVVDQNAYALLMLFIYLFAPLPFFLCSKAESSVLDGDDNGIETVGNFLVGMFSASAPCLTLVLLHGDFISDGGAVLSLFGGLFVFASAVSLHVETREDDFAM